MRFFKNALKNLPRIYESEADKNVPEARPANGPSTTFILPSENRTRLPLLLG